VKTARSVYNLSNKLDVEIIMTEEWMKKPKYVSKEEQNIAIGHVLWGDKNKKFSMLKLIFGFMKKPKKKGAKK
jgi:hypothetical protein